MSRFFRLMVALGVVFLLLWMFLPGTAPSVKQDSLLVLDLKGSYVESAEVSLLGRLFGGTQRSFVRLLSELRKAERDDRLSGVVLRIGPLEIGWAKAQEIRAAVADLRAAGRKTVAYLELTSFGANLEYYVASAAEEIHLAPGARAPVIGLAAEYLFLGGLWEKLGVELEIERIGRYKTAADTFAGTEMSDAHREMANALLDSIDAQFVAGIAEGRDLTPEFVRTAINTAAVSPDEMLALGLIDGIAFFDEIVAAAGDPPLVKASEYAAIDPGTLGIEPTARFALVYGSGSVVMGKSSGSSSRGPVLASETVSTALGEVAEDDEIDAIIFRIDSPGGSALASDVVWRATQLAREQGKPLIASFSDVAASGGYYVACGADAIVASPGSITGSIGVFVLRPVIGGLLEKFGVGVESLTRGDHADLLLSSRPLSQSSRKRLREEVESIYELFVERVSAGRDLAPERVDALARGRVWTGAQAAEIGLIDAVGGLRVAVAHAKELLELDPDADVALIPYPKPRTLVEDLQEALRGAVRVADLPQLSPLPLPRLVRRARQWLAAVPEGAPALLPPFVVDIR